MNGIPHQPAPGSARTQQATTSAGLLSAPKNQSAPDLTRQVTAQELLDLSHATRLHTRTSPNLSLADCVKGHLDVGVQHLVVNVCDVDPLHRQVETLCAANCNLIITGAALLAQGLQVSDVTVVHADNSDVGQPLREAISSATATNPATQWHTRSVPGALVQSKHASLVNLVLAGSALPRPAPAVATLMRSHKTQVAVYDAELLAALALAAQPTQHTPKYLVTTRHQDIAVVESEPETPVGRYFPANLTSPLVLVGGVEGQWATTAQAATLTASPASWHAIGLTPATSSYWFPTADECPVAITSRLLHFMASQSTRRCGPCVNGLPALAHAFDSAASSSDLTTITSIGRLLSGRGACSTPDGATRLARSALQLFPEHLGWTTTPDSRPSPVSSERAAGHHA